jgi:hypothetical protein
VEEYKNVRLPMRLFILSTEHILTGPCKRQIPLHPREGMSKKQYNLKIKEKKQTLRLTVQDDGHILK